MANKRITIGANKVYHIYNHAVGSEYLFRNNDNFKYFNPVVDTYAYCLLPKHFHLLIKIKDDVELIKVYKLKYRSFNLDPVGFQNPQDPGTQANRTIQRPETCSKKVHAE